MPFSKNSPEWLRSAAMESGVRFASIWLLSRLAAANYGLAAAARDA
jgi:hypothetical protein